MDNAEKDVGFHFSPVDSTVQFLRPVVVVTS